MDNIYKKITRIIIKIIGIGLGLGTIFYVINVYRHLSSSNQAIAKSVFIGIGIFLLIIIVVCLIICIMIWAWDTKNSYDKDNK